MSGLELQSEVAARAAILIVFLSDMGIADKALRQGVVDFLQKPFDPHHLLDRIDYALHAVSIRHTIIVRSSRNTSV